MNKKLTLSWSAMLLFLSFQLSAQLYPGLHTDNYSGIYNISYQPADIVDGRHLFDFNLFSFGLSAGNDYLALKKDALSNTNSWNDPLFKWHYVYENIPGASQNSNLATTDLRGPDKTAYLQTKVMLPSFSFSWGKNALALSFHANVAANVEGASEQLSYMIYRELKTPNLWMTAIPNQNISAQAMTWLDYGLTYGREIFRSGRHYLKGAGTVKLLQGIASAQLYANTGNVSFKNKDTMNISGAYVSYGHSSTFEFDANKQLTFNFQRPGVGFDLGFVYEYRKPKDQYTYEMDGVYENERQDKNKYIFKIGVSVTDIGAVPFTKGGQSRSFFADRQDIRLHDFSVNRVYKFDSVLVSKFRMQNDSGKDYTMTLPMKINLNVDVNLWKGFYANVSTSIAPRFKEDAAKTRSISNFMLTPRYEMKWFGIGVPFSYDALGNWGVGTYLRLGPLFVGTGDITPLLGRDNIYAANVFAGVKIPIYYGKGPRDKDGDKVSDKRDKCKNEPGTWENHGCPPVQDRDGDGVPDDEDLCPDVKGPMELKGCPDTDGDGILDKDDKCPDKPGLVEFNGCPDTDKDGIPDSDDACPTEAGDAKFQGCPDKDGDGIPDKDDKCPDVPGLKELNGCPDNDKDRDGIVDKEDECPTVPGLAKFKGCPDKDGDGVEDRVDKCPDVPGAADNAGCPWPDTDNDGVLDKDDECPKTPGLKELKGCPKVEAKEQEVLNTAFENLEFESAKDVIRTSSYTSLNELAELLKRKPTFGLLVEGHTDNVGDRARNQTLSEKRAEALKQYLVKKGIDGSRITTKGYGDTKPIGDNKTNEGRQKNRRVEMKVIFE